MVRIFKYCMAVHSDVPVCPLGLGPGDQDRYCRGRGRGAAESVDIARDAAIEDAQKRAVEQAIGILIDSQTQVENYQLISDKILSQTKGYITRYNVTGETRDGALLRVRITAEVSLGKLTNDLSAIGILIGQMHKPRTMIMIAEQNIGQNVNAWWLDPMQGRRIWASLRTPSWTCSRKKDSTSLTTRRHQKKST